MISSKDDRDSKAKDDLTHTETEKKKKDTLPPPLLIPQNSQRSRENEESRKEKELRRSSFAAVNKPGGGRKHLKTKQNKTKSQYKFSTFRTDDVP